MRDMPVLSAGEYRPYIHDGFQRGGYHIGCTLFYGILFMVPVITVVTSVLVLKEPVTWVSAVGTVLAVAGLFLSEYNGKGRTENRKRNTPKED